MNPFEPLNEFLDQHLPPATKKILLINVVAFLLMSIFSILKPDYDQFVFENLGQRPATFYLVWQFVTYMFIHADLFHLFFNMFILWMFGRMLEQHWGPRYFTIFYLGVGIGAGILHALITWIGVMTGNMHPALLNIPVIGASGAVYGLLIALACYFPDAEVMLLIPPIPMKLGHLAIGLIAISAIMQISGPGDGISHLTHLTGCVVAYGMLAVKHRDPNFKTWRWR